MTLPIRVRSVLGCDDVRDEPNGKLIAIGLFGPDLELSLPPNDKSPPAGRVVKMHCLLSVDILEPGEHVLEFQLLSSAGGGGTARVTVEFTGEAQQVPFSVGPMTVKVPQGRSRLTFSIKDGGRWKRLTRWQVETVAGRNAA